MEVYSFRELLGKKVLIMGDTGTGKTRLAAELLHESIRLGHARNTTVIDLAPAISLRPQKVIGCPLTTYVNSLGEVHYLRPPRVRAPRLEAKNPAEVLKLAEENAREMSAVFDDFSRRPSDILFVNDVSLYLHVGDFDRLLSVVSRSKTCILNGYYGTSLDANHDSGISIRERALMDELAKRMDLIIKLYPGGPKSR